jgi:DMSO/TMAO reductase YedYZ molybdopterin-dependent catalytic subunit
MNTDVPRAGATRSLALARDLPRRLWAERARWLPLALVGLAAGLVASVTATLVMGVLRLWWGTSTAPELLGEVILPHLTAAQFVNLLIQYRPNSKTGPLGQTLLGQLALGVGLGLGFVLAVLREEPRTRWPRRRAVVAALLLALGMEVVAVLLFWPVLPAGLYGDPIGRARLLTAFALLLAFLAFAYVLLFASHLLRQVWRPAAAPAAPSAPTVVAEHAPAAATPPSATTRPASLVEALWSGALRRREALLAGGAVVLYVGASGLVARDLIGRYLDRSSLSYDGMSTPSPNGNPITPTDQFYVVTKNVLDPTVAPERWQLEVAGLVGQPRAWSYAETLKLPSETRAITLECISNDVGGHLLSTAVWRGISLERLLGLAGGARPTGKYVIFTSVDGYHTSLPLADLLAARTLLAWEMNGQPLPQRHGYPLRAIVPGRYGEQSAKWLSRVELVDQPFKGFYQSQGWSDAQLSTLSRIDAPSGTAGRGTVTVAGVAFAGIRGIRRVEVSADNGATWHDATFAPPPSDQTWVLWTWPWTPLVPGSYTLVVRATDGTNAVQTATQRGTVPDGSTGWHSVRVEVR